jgi:TonB family protein
MGVEVGGGDATDTNSRRQALDAFFNAASDAVRQWRYQSPADPPIAFYVSVRFEPDREAVATQSQEPSGPGRGGQGLTVTTTFPTQSQSIASASMRLEELRLQERQLRERLGPQHPDLMKVQQQIQEMERELERARGLEQNAAELRQRAEAVRIAGQNGGTTGVRVAGPGTVTAVPVRVGGNVRPPTKTKHVDPEYPPIAKSARVQGVVIMEVVIDEQGRVAEARILRSIPLLDQAALDAVRQWEFTPTLLNGSPVPIVLTTTVQFVLPEPSPQ